MNLGQAEKWMARDRPRAVKLQILALVVGSAPEPVQEWEKDEIIAQSSPAGAVLDACGDYCDCKEESVAFRWQWVDIAGNVLTATTHRHAPTDSATGIPSTEADISQNRVIAQFMRHDETKEKLQITSLGIFVSAFEKLLTLTTRQNDALAAQNLLLWQQLQAARERTVATDDREPSEEERTECLARANAFNKASELAPVVLEAVLEGWQRSQKKDAA